MKIYNFTSEDLLVIFGAFLDSMEKLTKMVNEAANSGADIIARGLKEERNKVRRLSNLFSNAMYTHDDNEQIALYAAENPQERIEGGKKWIR